MKFTKKVLKFTALSLSISVVSYSVFADSITSSSYSDNNWNMDDFESQVVSFAQEVLDLGDAVQASETEENQNFPQETAKKIKGVSDDFLQMTNKFNKFMEYKKNLSSILESFDLSKLISALNEKLALGEAVYTENTVINEINRLKIANGILEIAGMPVGDIPYLESGNAKIKAEIYGDLGFGAKKEPFYMSDIPFDSLKETIVKEVNNIKAKNIFANDIGNTLQSFKDFVVYLLDHLDVFSKLEKDALQKAIVSEIDTTEYTKLTNESNKWIINTSGIDTIGKELKTDAEDVFKKNIGQGNMALLGETVKGWYGLLAGLEHRVKLDETFSASATNINSLLLEELPEGYDKSTQITEQNYDEILLKLEQVVQAELKGNAKKFISPIAKKVLKIGEKLEDVDMLYIVRKYRGIEDLIQGYASISGSKIGLTADEESIVYRISKSLTDESPVDASVKLTDSEKEAIYQCYLKQYKAMTPMVGTDFWKEFNNVKSVENIWEMNMYEVYKSMYDKMRKGKIGTVLSKKLNFSKLASQLSDIFMKYMDKIISANPVQISADVLTAVAPEDENVQSGNTSLTEGNVSDKDELLKTENPDSVTNLENTEDSENVVNANNTVDSGNADNDENVVSSGTSRNSGNSGNSSKGNSVPNTSDVADILSFAIAVISAALWLNTKIRYSKNS